jgi:D-glycerate 3-kinase
MGCLWPSRILSQPDFAALWKRVRKPFFQQARRLDIAEPVAEILAHDYLPLSAWVTAQKKDRPLVLGVNGAQGSGKSTLCEFLTLILAHGYGLRAVGFSLDDLYRTRAERERLARQIHPLLITRGVPGTHDVELGCRLLDALRSAGPGADVALPSFDKAVDDRRPRAEWPTIEGPVDVVIFEGWCVGCKPQADEDLVVPINALEAEEDPDGSWRRYVNDQIKGHYANLFARIDRLLMLCVPSMNSVFEWRSLQERKLAASLRLEGGPDQYRLMDDSALRRFIMHYERITRHALAEMPARADITLFLDEAHRFSRVHLAS